MIKKGFALVEVMIVIGIIAILFGISSFSVIGLPQQVSLNTTVDTLTTDLKSQQLKAMVGDTEGRTSHDSYGIHFDANDYVLFHGMNYVIGDTNNFPITPGQSIQFSTTFPNGQIVYDLLSGEVDGFTGGQNTITVKNTVSGQQKVITINKYGTIVSIN